MLIKNLEIFLPTWLFPATCLFKFPKFFFPTCLFPPTCLLFSSDFTFLHVYSHLHIYSGVQSRYSRLSFNSAACLFIFEMIFLPTCSYQNQHAYQILEFFPTNTLFQANWNVEMSYRCSKTQIIRLKMECWQIPFKNVLQALNKSMKKC